MSSAPFCCFVLGCPNSEGNLNATFHKFPEKLREEWLTAIGRSPDTFIIDELICSEHFDSKDFEICDSVKILKRNVLPTLNLPEQSENGESLFVSNPPLNTSTCEELEQLIQRYNGLEKSKPIKVSSNTICTVLKPSADKTYKYETAPLNSINVILVTDESKELSRHSSSEENLFQLSELNDEESTDEYHIEVGDIRNCRTCLDEIDPNGGYRVTDIHCERKTLKEIIVFCIPQMASTLVNTDLICSKCLDSFKFCMNFIENCLKVETELLENFVSIDSNESNDDLCKNDMPEMYRHISLDHNYVPKIESDCDIFQDDVPKSLDYARISDPLSTRHKCSKCGKTFKTKNYLLDHVRRQHNKPELKKRGYDCDFCDKLFLTKLGYDLHLRLSHRDQEGKPEKLESLQRSETAEDTNSHQDTLPSGHSCHVCGKDFKNAANLKFHMRSHDDPDLYLCHKCGRIYKTSASLHIHLKHHNPNVRYRCEDCQSSFRQKSGLNLHRKLYHLGLREYKCSVCDRRFSCKNSLDSHYSLKHAEAKTYQCETCGVGFARADYLKRHVTCGDETKCKGYVSHKRKYRFVTRDSGPITCKLCDKEFRDVYLLRVHVKSHATLRKFKCRTCNLAFTTAPNRNRHEKVHQSSKFRCEVCFKRMDTQEALDEHCSTTHENTRKYKCHVCGELFCRKYLLDCHVGERHGDVEDFKKEEEVLYRMVMEDYLVDN